ncbi:MAG: alpha-E domain-containing protein, partial [Bacteroidota bacterium]
MLSRVANNLYWMGRYLERSEHLARYTKVQYFSLYDAPHLQSIDFVLSSIVNMTGIDYDISETPIDEQDVIHEVGLARSNYSIFSYVLAARENARSARNVLSDELWEVINQYYRFVQEYDPDYFKVRGLFEFTYEVNKHC